MSDIQTCEVCGATYSTERGYEVAAAAIQRKDAEIAQLRGRAEAAEAQVARVTERHAKLREALERIERPSSSSDPYWWRKVAVAALALDAKEPT